MSNLSLGVIWQGFRHAWQYNHRVNRLGSYVEQRGGVNGAPDVVAVHTAASGTGGDVADFTEFVTPVAAEGVGFQSGWRETLVECQRGEINQFRIKVADLPLDKALVGRDRYAVIINGFDLYASEYSDKLIAFELEITDPVFRAGETTAEFNILGSMAFDCRSPECQMLPMRLEIENRAQPRAAKLPTTTNAQNIARKRHVKRGLDRRRVERFATWVKRQLVQVTNLNEVKEDVISDDLLRRRLFRFGPWQFFLRLLKTRISTPYVLRVHYLLIGGDEDAFRVTETDVVDNQYTFDVETEVRRETEGVRSVLATGAPPADYAVNTLGFRKIMLETQLDPDLGTTNPAQWGEGMHLLEWNVAISDLQVREAGVQANVDLFYKCWSDAMNEVVTLVTWGAIRAAGRAVVGARLALLQFRYGTSPGQIALPGAIHWPGAGLSAVDDLRAFCVRPIPVEGAYGATDT